MSIKFKTDKSWKKLEQTLGAKVQKKLVLQHMTRANLLNGKYAEKIIKERIKQKKYVKNRPLTVAIKGEDHPLIGVEGGATLFNNITSKETRPRGTVFIGVIRASKIYNIAVALHEGVSIPVTEKMRAMFRALWMVSEGKMDENKLTGRAAQLWEWMPGNWKPLKASTKFIVIQARPFIKDVLNDDVFRKRVMSNWNKAMRQAFAEMKAMSQ